MEIKRCMSCMEELSENVQRCPACGVDNRRIEQPNYALRCGSMLHGRYLVGKVLGQGGFGITYIGMDMLLNIKVAMKEYFPMGMVTRDSGGSSKILWSMSQANQSQRQSGYESFLKEARKMARIDEIPSIVRVRDLFLENETAYIVMDFVEGVTLKQKLQKNGPIAFSECFALLRPMMEDLAKVHKQGMIHRDISPDNIMIREDGKVRLLDLGAAKDMTTAHGVSSQVVAKNGFSPLEQYMNNGKIGPWTDVYALCATIYYCITGKLLPGALERLDNSELDFPDGMKEPLTAKAAKTLRAGLGVRAENRIPSVEELLERFAASESLPEAVNKPSPGNKSGQEKERRLTAENSAPVQQSPYVRAYPEDKLVTPGPAPVQQQVKQSPNVRVYRGNRLVTPNPAPVQQKVQQSPFVRVYREEKKISNLPAMMSDVLPEELTKWSSEVLGNSNIKRSEVYMITFLSRLQNVPGNAWDVSAGRNRTVMAWTEAAQGGYHLYIGGEGGVRAPQICKDLFSNYSKVTEINFNSCFDTGCVTDMDGMFNWCENLSRLDVSSFDTSRVTNMNGMFNCCRNMSSLDVSSFNTGCVTDMTDMFACCKKLERLDICSFDMRNVTYMDDMFDSCQSLKQLYVSNFYIAKFRSNQYLFENCPAQVIGV